MYLLKNFIQYVFDYILGLAGILVGGIGIMTAYLVSRPLGIILLIISMIMIWKQGEIEAFREENNQWEFDMKKSVR